MDDFDVGEGGEDLSKDRNEGGVEFDGEDAGGAAGKVAGEAAQAGADFQDRIGSGYIARVHDFFQCFVIYQKVLTETLFGVESISAKKGRDIEGREGR